MKATKAIAVLALLIGMAITSSAQALDQTTNIDMDTTWTKADSPVFLKKPVFVLNEATLTIEAGVVVVTLPADDGGLVVTRGCQIFVLGTRDEPVIMTSAADVATWTGSVMQGTAPNYTGITTLGDPKTGTWREAAHEWRNLTVLGRGVISASEFGGVPVGPPTDGGPDDDNPTVVDGTAQKDMEGLDAVDAGGVDDNIRYGGAVDADDSGVIRYLSSRYTGRVLGAGNELNGISLGGLGSATDIEFLDLMNNVDDGVEIWGGKVNLRYVNIWNIGDDSFDFDQGWRGKAQFGLIVQGWSLDANQGSGVGDNIFEHDGGEQSDVQPTTRAAIYNFTAIGQRLSGDGATTWRDNAGVQYRKCIFMEVGEELVRYDGDDGDGGKGYTDLNGVYAPTDALQEADFVALWSTPWNSFPNYNNGSGQFAPTASFYSGQVDGTICEISDSVFHKASKNGAIDGDDRAVAVGVVGVGFTSAGTNVVDDVNLPIQSITRDAPVTKGGKAVEFVSGLNPLPAAAALTAAVPASADPFFADTTYRGGFAPNHNWLVGWTAADAFSNIAISGASQPDPTASIALSWTVEFDTVSGVLYVVEVSTDGNSWLPVATITGDGSTMSYTDNGAFVAAKQYRVRPL